MCVSCRPASESRVLTCAAVWRMPPEWESGSHESPDDSSNNPQTLELLCHLDNTAHGSMAWYATRYRFNPAASLFSPSFLALLSFSSWLLFPFLSLISLCLSLLQHFGSAFLQSIVQFFSRYYRNLFALYFMHPSVWFHFQPLHFSFVSVTCFISCTIIHNTEKNKNPGCVLKLLPNGRPSYSHPSDEGVTHTNGISLQLKQQIQ